VSRGRVQLQVLQQVTQPAWHQVTWPVAEGASIVKLLWQHAAAGILAFSCQAVTVSVAVWVKNSSSRPAHVT
jgi:hypothetical protein